MHEMDESTDIVIIDESTDIEIVDDTSGKYDTEEPSKNEEKKSDTKELDQDDLDDTEMDDLDDTKKNDSVGTENDDEEIRQESPKVSERLNCCLKKELEETVQDLKQRKILPDIVAELIEKKKLNRMIVDLYDYDKGFDISFSKYGEDEIFHGQYSYGVSLIEYIKDGEIPYELLDDLKNYDFQVYYDGCVVCQIRVRFKQEESTRSHFVLLRHTIQTIIGECLMKKKADESLDFDAEMARLINQNSPDLCLDPDPVVADIVVSNELNQHPFINHYLKHIILNEKARREIGVKEMSKKGKKVIAPTNSKDDTDWSFRMKEPSAEETELSETASNMRRKRPIESYVKCREICYPDKDSFTGFPVEIENFVYEYDGETRGGDVERIEDILCIGVKSDKEFYYGAYKLDQKMKDWTSFYWWDIGSRELLDAQVNAITEEEMKLTAGGMKITHNRLFDEQVKYSNGEMNVVCTKLKEPASKVIFTNENEEMEEDSDSS